MARPSRQSRPAPPTSPCGVAASTRSGLTALPPTANMAINSFRADWFEEVLSSLSQVISMSEDDMRKAWSRLSYFTDTMHYVHPGQPEHLFVETSIDRGSPMVTS